MKLTDVKGQKAVELTIEMIMEAANEMIGTVVRNIAKEVVEAYSDEEYDDVMNIQIELADMIGKTAIWKFERMVSEEEDLETIIEGCDSIIDTVIDKYDDKFIDLESEED